MCSFFHSSITFSSSTPSSQRRSRASSARLAKYRPRIRRMSCISTSEDTLEISSSISIWNGVNGFGCTIVASILTFFCSGCKYTTNKRNKQIKRIKTGKPWKRKALVFSRFIWKSQQNAVFLHLVMKMNRMETTDKAMILAPFDESLQPQKRMEAAVELSQLVTEIVTYVICHTIVTMTICSITNSMKATNSFFTRCHTQTCRY